MRPISQRPLPNLDLDALGRDALIEHWPAGQVCARAHSHAFGSVQFDQRSDADSRFSTIRVGGRVIPVLYGGEDEAAAASETIFHTVDHGNSSTRPRQVFLSKYLTWQWTKIAITRDTELVRLDDKGLEAIHTTRATLIEGGRPTYPVTRQWAQAIAEALPHVDGLWWQSRQDRRRWAVMWFGAAHTRSGGLGVHDVAPEGTALPFSDSAGADRLDAIALDFDITVVRG